MPPNPYGPGRRPYYQGPSRQQKTAAARNDEEPAYNRYTPAQAQAAANRARYYQPNGSGQPGDPRAARYTPTTYQLPAVYRPPTGSTNYPEENRYTLNYQTQKAAQAAKAKQYYGYDMPTPDDYYARHKQPLKQRNYTYPEALNVPPPENSGGGGGGGGGGYYRGGGGGGGSRAYGGSSFYGPQQQQGRYYQQGPNVARWVNELANWTIGR